MNILKKTKHKIQGRLSHHPKTYALIVGVGIVLFWRGVWHSADYFHEMISNLSSNSSLSLPSGLWWDGPLSFLVGFMMLYFTRAFTSSFIGNELILSGLRGEKKLSERTEEDLKNEVTAIADIKDELIIISKKLEILHSKAHENHKNVEE
jgi:hypothetical protein